MILTLNPLVMVIFTIFGKAQVAYPAAIAAKNASRRDVVFFVMTISQLPNAKSCALSDVNVMVQGVVQYIPIMHWASSQQSKIVSAAT